MKNHLIVIGFWITVGSNFFSHAGEGETAPFRGSIRESLGENNPAGLYNHFADFPKNTGAVSDEQGERIHQDFKVIKARYQGRWDVHMMADYCWSIKR
ncbi:hypothetical protein AVEN_105594-1 [Araneus ventricosus]|uniref:Uncharacterized protein n=1 Tax=Araneus ventricosus TaxID=182803 RepID=A0A4Y2W8D3_ARAVE|nr:hypothetical protein AVEN_105594-1 [Araneus ventricosus]